MREREDLEAARVGEDRPVPAREAMQAAVRFDDLQAGAQVQVEGVAEDDLGAERADLFGQHALHRAIGAHGHEGGRFHGAARKMQAAAARGAVVAQLFEGHAAHAALSVGACSGHSSIASP
jgi:hypothetical protein